MLQISEIVRKTEEMFDLFNEHFYEGELSRPAITVLCPKTCHRQPSFLKNGIRKAGNLSKISCSVVPPVGGWYSVLKARVRLTRR